MMKNFKKLSALLVVFAMVFAVVAPVFAEGKDNRDVVIKNDLSGHTYEAYQIFAGDLNDAGVLSNIVWGSGVKGAALLSKLNGNVTPPTYADAAAVADAMGKTLSAEDFRDVVKELLSDTHTDSVQAGSGPYTYTISGLKDGYYFIKDKDNSLSGDNTYTAFMLKVVKDLPNVTPKTDKPSIEKKIDGATDTDNETTGLTDTNNVAIGDKVPYVITTKIPDTSNFKVYKTFKIQDKLSAGLTFNNDVVVKVNDKILVEGADKDYTIEKTNLPTGVTFQISLVDVKKHVLDKKYATGNVVKVTYSAKVNKDAVIGEAGNPNDIKLIYSNNPNWDGSGTNSNEPTGETPWDKVISYLTGLKVSKIDGNNKLLAGAEFEISGTRLNQFMQEKKTFEKNDNGKYYLLKNGTYTETAPASDGSTDGLYESTTQKYIVKMTQELISAAGNPIHYTGKINADGTITFKGLSAGTYTLKEIKAPSGYNLLKDPITIKISAAYDLSKLTCNWSAVKILKDGKEEKISLNSETKLFELSVMNKKGATLPETGGMGTTILYILGSLLAIGSGVVLVTKKIMVSNK